MSGSGRESSSGKVGAAGIMAAAGALASVAVTAPAASGLSVFVVAMLLWACVPYAGVFLLTRLTAEPPLRAALAVGIAWFAAFDIFIRYQALHQPSGSTDALVILFLPLWSLPVVGVTGAVAGLIVYWRRGSSAPGQVDS